MLSCPPVCPCLQFWGDSVFVLPCCLKDSCWSKLSFMFLQHHLTRNVLAPANERFWWLQPISVPFTERLTLRRLKSQCSPWSLALLLLPGKMATCPHTDIIQFTGKPVWVRISLFDVFCVSQRWFSLRPWRIHIHNAEQCSDSSQWSVCEAETWFQGEQSS